MSQFTCQVHCDEGGYKGKIKMKVSKNFGVKLRACEKAWEEVDVKKLWQEASENV